MLLLTRALPEAAVDRAQQRLARLRVPHLLLRRDDLRYLAIDDEPEHLERVERFWTARRPSA